MPDNTFCHRLFTFYIFRDKKSCFGLFFRQWLYDEPSVEGYYFLITNGSEEHVVFYQQVEVTPMLYVFLFFYCLSPYEILEDYFIAWLHLYVSIVSDSLIPVFVVENNFIRNGLHNARGNGMFPWLEGGVKIY